MSCKCPQHTKQFKLNVVNYCKEHPDLTQTEVTKNLGIGISSFAHWKTQDVFVYLNCVMDLFIRKIIVWTLADTMKVSASIKMTNKAKACQNTDLPLIIHSDHGNQYISNACIESFHSLIKKE